MCVSLPIFGLSFSFSPCVLHLPTYVGSFVSQPLIHSIEMKKNKESAHASVRVLVHLLDQTTLIIVYDFLHPGWRWSQLTLHPTFLCSTASFERGRIVLVGKKKILHPCKFLWENSKKDCQFKVHYTSVPHDPNRIDAHQRPSLVGKTGCTQAILVIQLMDFR